MKIYIQCFHKVGFTLDVPAETKIHELKWMIKELNGSKVENQNILFNGSALLDQNSIASSGIQCGNNILMYVSESTEQPCPGNCQIFVNVYGDYILEVNELCLHDTIGALKMVLSRYNMADMTCHSQRINFAGQNVDNDKVTLGNSGIGNRCLVYVYKQSLTQSPTTAMDEFGYDPQDVVRQEEKKVGNSNRYVHQTLNAECQATVNNTSCHFLNRNPKDDVNTDIVWEQADPCPVSNMYRPVC